MFKRKFRSSLISLLSFKTILVFRIGRIVKITRHTSRSYWWMSSEHVNTDVSRWRYSEWRHLHRRQFVRVAATDLWRIHTNTGAPRRQNVSCCSGFVRVRGGSRVFYVICRLARAYTAMVWKVWCLQCSHDGLHPRNTGIRRIWPLPVSRMRFRFEWSRSEWTCIVCESPNVCDY